LNLPLAVGGPSHEDDHEPAVKLGPEADMDRQSVQAEMQRAAAELRALATQASPSDLRRGSDGTRWTNEQLLFHMVFGYMVVRALLPLVRLFGQLPDRAGRVFAGVLDAGRRPFHQVNYLGSCGGPLVFHGPRLIRQMDRTVATLHRKLDQETDDALSRTMHFPVDWDPFFRDQMTLLEVYHYGTQHFEFHRQQLTLGPAADRTR
jgi:DinB family protein